jgi:hypothetical protein
MQKLPLNISKRLFAGEFLVNFLIVIGSIALLFYLAPEHRPNRKTFP